MSCLCNENFDDIDRLPFNPEFIHTPDVSSPERCCFKMTLNSDPLTQPLGPPQNVDLLSGGGSAMKVIETEGASATVLPPGALFSPVPGYSTSVPPPDTGPDPGLNFAPVYGARCWQGRKGLVRVTEAQLAAHPIYAPRWTGYPAARDNHLLGPRIGGDDTTWSECADAAAAATPTLFAYRWLLLRPHGLGGVLPSNWRLIRCDRGERGRRLELALEIRRVGAAAPAAQARVRMRATWETFISHAACPASWKQSMPGAAR